MGLRLKSKLFMSAAFKLPSTMHYHIVEMTQPLIEDCPISMASFEALSLDLENHPLTPIHQSRNIKAPLTCPVISKVPMLPFGHKELNVTGPDLTFDDTHSGNELSYRCTGHSLYSSPQTFFESLHVRKGKSCITKSGFGNDFESEIDSPLYSLKSILESPQVVPKGQLLSKLDEIRSLSSKLSEVQHLYEENMCELSRLSSELQASEMKRKETEIRLKRRESELNEVRDELAYEIEMRSFHEQRSNLVDHLQESLNDALEKLKVVNRLDKENQELLKENRNLKTKEKELESIRSRLSSQQELEHQLTQMKVVARLADSEIHELLCHRERLLARSEAECVAQANSLIHVSNAGSAESLASVVMINNQLHDLESAVVKARTDYQIMRKKYIVQRFNSLFGKVLAKHRGSMINTFQYSCEVLTKELDNLKSVMHTRFEKLCEKILSSEAKLTQANKEVTEIKVKQIKVITELCAQKKQLSIEMDKIRLESEIGFHEWENKVNLLKTENYELNAKIASIHSCFGGGHVKIDEELKKMKEADMEVSKLKSKVVEVEDKYDKLIILNKDLRAELNDQIDANKAFRASAEEELVDEKEKVSQVSALSDRFKSEVADLRCNLSKTREHLLEVEESLKVKNDVVLSLQSTNNQLEDKLSLTETSYKLKEKEVCRLVSQIIELESENKRSSEKIDELENLAKSSSHIQLDLEHHLETLRSQLNEMESGWLSTRAQLAETRQQLIKTEELLHDTRLRLLRANYEKAEVLERLTLTKPKNGRTQSTLDLTSDMSSTTYNNVSTGIKLVHSESASGDFSCKNKLSSVEIQNNLSKIDHIGTASKPAGKSFSDIAVQKCDPRSHRICLNHSSGDMKEWPPYSSITAPVSPGGLKKENHKALSGTSIPFHSCRFGRLIISPDGDEAKELRSITYQMTHKLYSAPSKTENENQLVEMELNTPATSISTEHEKQHNSESVSLGLPYIPETPAYMLNMANLSRSCSAYEIATVPLKLSCKSDLSLSTKNTLSSTSNCSFPMNNDKPKFKYGKWVPKKLHKRSKHGVSQDLKIKVGRFLEPYPPSSNVQRNKELKEDNSANKSTWHRVWSKNK
ncbi:putative dna double-strand break repair rad50 ATPase [Schistosoma mansoni]|uniref:putative dna double-strand break repair rad50 ATPase n=1 Tax=Schistosoma mansoni TaxID=6183 RepID=UPI0001A63BB2|nr:putative dna double-strand break repair rad50 ATPase [Schistosoma mansoni]|eukprot:XP_018654966.1 putative dna double-strand break repair rad50 ATPase [Schistosoma mansoni]